MLRKNRAKAIGWYVIRHPRGNMIVLIGSLAAGIVVALLLFALAYTRMLGGNSEQKTAIEAAALAAAKDLSRVVIEDDHFGWIGLSDYAPVGSVTVAPDGYFTPVTSINTILGTIRLDMILGDQVSTAIGSPNSMQRWQTLADEDYNAAITAKGKLISVLQNSISPNGSGATDISGQPINAYKSAEDAYKQNQMRMTGGSSYVAGSLVLSLGCLQGGGGETTVQVPTPQSKASLNGQPTQNGKYMSYINYPYKGKDFVFAGTGSQIKLVDSKKFGSSISGVPWFIPTIVRAEAQQKWYENGNKSGVARVIKAIACAQPACVPDPKPAPGLLAIDFPDGMVKSLNIPADLLNQGQLNSGPNPASVVKPTGGDYIGPGGPAVLTPVPSLTGQQPASGMAMGMYDWVRRGGTKVNIDSVISMVQGAGIQNGFFTPNKIYKYIIDSAGNVQESEKGTGKEPYIAVSENQIYMSCTDAMDDIKSNQVAVTDASGNPVMNADGTPKMKSVTNSPWCVYMKDECRQWGDKFGGQHAGQPLPIAGTILAAEPTDKWVACLPSALPDNAIALNGTSGSAKLGDFGGWGSGANDNGFNGGLIKTTSAPLGTFDDWPTQGELSISYPFTAMSPAGSVMPPTYLQNGAVVMIRWRREEVTDATGALTPGFFKK